MLKFIKILLILVLLVVCVAAGFYYALNHFPLEKMNTNGVNLALFKNLSPASMDTLIKAQSLLPKNMSLSTLLELKPSPNGTASTTPPTLTSPQQQALEYVRYTYCQQVVKDYQQRYSTGSASYK